MNVFKRFLSMLLVLCLLIGVGPMTAHAEETDGAVTEAAETAQEPTDPTGEPAEVAEAVPASDADYGIALASIDSITMGDKPSDSTTTGEPFPQGTGGSNSFRIPALVTLSDGTLVAAADARWNSTLDNGGIDTLVSVSTDNGANWYYSYANYLGDNGNEYNNGSTCFIDPALAVDSNDNIYMLVDLYPYGVAIAGTAQKTASTAVGFNDAGKLLLSGDNHSTYNYYLDGDAIYSFDGTKVEGYTVDEYFNITDTGTGDTSNLFFSNSPYKVVRTGYLYLTKGTYNASAKSISWSEPTLIPNVKTTSEYSCLVGPGRGLVTSNGMIVFPVYKYIGTVSDQMMSFIYSLDDGETWSRSSECGVAWSSEAAVVELKDGTLRFFYRNGTAELCYVDYANDGNWDNAVSTGIPVNSNTQLSAISYSKTVGGKQVILVSCPIGSGSNGSSDNSGNARLNGKIFAFTVGDGNALTLAETITVKSDDAMTVNGEPQFMYSCLTELNNGQIAILNEDGENAWGGGSDSYYYTMSYSTYDLSLTSDDDTSDGDTSDGDTSDGDTDADSSDVTPTKTVDVYVKVGETSQTYTDTTGNYEASAEIKDESIATMTATGSTVEGGTTTTFTQVETITSGSAYYISDGNGNYLTLSNGALTNTTDITAATQWTVTYVDTPSWAGGASRYTVSSGWYYIQLSGNQLSATSQTWGPPPINHYYTVAGGFYGSSDGSNAWVYKNGWTVGTAGDSSAKLYTYESVTTDPTTKTDITFTGVKVGETTAVVGTTQYNITVYENQPITINYVLGDETVYTETKDIDPYNDTSVTLETTVEGVDGNTYAVNNTTLPLTAGVSTYDVPVTLKPAEDNSVGTGTSKYLYIDIPHIQNCTVYYAVNAGEIIEITDDMLEPVDEAGTCYRLKIPLFDVQYEGGFQISFFAKPDEGYALTSMYSTGSALQFYSLVSSDGDVTKTDAWPFSLTYTAWPQFDTLTTKPAGDDATVWKDNNGLKWPLIEGNFTVAQLQDLLTRAKALGCDGMQVFTKNKTGNTNASTGDPGDNDLVTNLEFVAEKLPEIYKVLSKVSYIPQTDQNGDKVIDENDRVTVDYTEGMHIGIGYTLHYTIYVAVPKMAYTPPKESGVTADEYYIEYSNIVVSDALNDDEWSLASANSEGVATSFTWNDTTVEVEKFDSPTNWKNPLTDGSVTTFPREGFAYTSSAGETAEYSGSCNIYAFNSTLTLSASNFLSVVQDGTIHNTAELKYDYSAKYSAGTLSRESNAAVDVLVVVPEYVIDFGLPVVIDLTNDPLVQGDKIKEASAKYGEVTIDTNNPRKIVYTPNQILPGIDFITLTFYDLNSDSATENESTALVGYGVRIYPATTVYYEETFLEIDENNTSKWEAKGDPVNSYQSAVVLGKAGDNNYGFDSAYADDGGVSSNGTYITSNNGGLASFTFTGTGFELYANSNSGSGYVTVYSEGKLSKLYFIDTVLSGSKVDGDITNDQQADANEKLTYYNLPIISETELPYGTYVVQIKQTNGDKPIYIDGVRIINTIDESTLTDNTKSIYYDDQEDKPVFYELRDYVLKAIGVEDLDKSDYISSDDRSGLVDAVSKMAGQVYNAISDDDTEDAAIIIDTDNTSFKDNHAQDLLDNGPKNELYLYPNQMLVFKVTTKRVMQLGLKSPIGNAKFTLNVTEGDAPKTLDLNSLSTTVDMFYKIADKKTDETTYTVSITVTEGVLSVTDLKICDDPGFSFKPLTQEDIEDILLGLYDVLDEEISERVDINGDGSLNAKDATTILRWVVGKLPDVPANFEQIADINGDGTVSAKDATMILRFVVGKVKIPGWENE